MNLTELPASALTFNAIGGSSGLGTGNVGTWTFDNAFVGFRQGAAMRTVTAGDYVEFTATGRDFYLVTVLGPNLVGGEFTVTVDGTLQAGKFRTTNGALFGNTTGKWYRVYMPIARGLKDKSHTIRITALGTGAATPTVHVNSIFAISGDRPPATDGRADFLSDSYGLGNGATTPLLNGWVPRVHSFLQTVRKGSVVGNNFNVSGDRIIGTDNTKTGLTDRFITSVLAPVNGVVSAAPRWLCNQIGANDLNGLTGSTAPGDWQQLCTWLFCLFADCLDLSQTIVTFGTPPPMTPAYMMQSYPLIGITNWGSPVAALKGAVQAVHVAGYSFPDIRIAPVYEMLGRQSHCFYPNNAGDRGIHPNDVGYGFIANAHIWAITHPVFED